MPSISAIHSVNAGLCGVFGILFNILLIWLIMRRSVPALRLYRSILLQTCIIDIYTICLMMVVQPIYVVVSGWNISYLNGPARFLPLPYSIGLNLLWYFGFYFSITSNALQFFYRYLVLCRNTKITPMRYFLLISATVVPVVFYLCILCIVSYPEQTQLIVQLSSEIFSVIQEDVTIIMLAKSDSNSWRYIHLFYVAPYDISCYIVIITCGIKIRRSVQKREQEKQMCSQAMKYNRQISITLVLQAILPCIGALVNSVQLLATIMVSSTSAIYSTAFVTIVIHWVPVLNPLITILVIKSYRRVVFRSQN